MTHTTRRFTCVDVATAAGLDAGPRRGKEQTYRCPRHDDEHPTLTINPTKNVWMCPACNVQGTAYQLAAFLAQSHPADKASVAHWLRAHGLMNGNGDGKRRIVATYDYTDEGGAILYQNVRTSPKGFFARRPDGRGGWITNLEGTRRVLYNLPELHRAATLIVQKGVTYVVEGEKDVDRLHSIGIIATTNAGGALKWCEDYTHQLITAGVKSIVIVPDNDEPGRKHADCVARSCQAAGLDVKLVTLPDLPAKGDISDWLDAGHTRDELIGLVENTALYAPSPAASTAITSATEVEVVDIAALLTDIIDFVRRYVVVTIHQAIAIALWVVHTHAIDAADCTPYLQATSATKRSGKTRLLEVLEPLVARPWFTGRMSAAVLVRKIDAERPTLLLDESDAAFNGDKEYAEALRGVICAGYRRSGKASLCIGQGANITFKDFSTFGAKAIAGIGQLPGTIADRCIRIELRRRTRDERCDRWRERDGHQEAHPIQDRVAIWAARALDTLRDARPELPTGLNDRAVDVWEPLLAIADQAGPVWGANARDAARELSGNVEDDPDLPIELLHDIKEIFNEKNSAPFIKSVDLVQWLCDRDDRPWATWKKGKPLTSHALARLLKPFHILPGPNAAGTERGYDRDRFVDAWTRYPGFKPSERQNTNKHGAELNNSKCQTTGSPDTLKMRKTPIEMALSDDLTLQTAELQGDASDLF